MRFEILLTDDNAEHVEADGYALEGPLTTFFRAQAGRTPRLDPWAVRLLSIRTDRIARIHVVDHLADHRVDHLGGDRWPALQVV